MIALLPYRYQRRAGNVLIACSHRHREGQKQTERPDVPIVPHHATDLRLAALSAWEDARVAVERAQRLQQRAYAAIVTAPGDGLDG
jgi:hypothetical protein